MVGLWSWLIALACVAWLGQEPAQATAPKPQSPAGPPDFKVVFWFQGATLKHQVYDVRKGQYTQAVDDWVHKIRYDPSGTYVVPGPMATVRDVRLAKEAGTTEAEKLARGIARERKAILGALAADLPHIAHIYTYDRGFSSVPSPSTPFNPLPLTPRTPGEGAYPMVPTAPVFLYPFPVPMPYPRPHP